MYLGSWIMKHGSWSMEHGTWNMDHESWMFYEFYEYLLILTITPIIVKKTAKALPP